jgi:hypothetical protein
MHSRAPLGSKSELQAGIFGWQNITIGCQPDSGPAPYSVGLSESPHQSPATGLARARASDFEERDLWACAKAYRRNRGADAP